MLGGILSTKIKMPKDDISYVLNILREGTITWSGRNECLKLASKKVFDRNSKTSGNPIYKIHWQCRNCLEWFRDKGMVEVDHIIEIGPFTGSFDEFISRMYCGQDNLQVLCKICHAKKTARANASRIYERKKK